jgi:hypothetical protein
MPLPIDGTIGILADNLKIRKSVLPISVKSATRWAEGLNLPKGGETVIYTGLMYQLIPYIEAMSKAQEKIEDTWLVDFIKYGQNGQQGHQHFRIYGQAFEGASGVF